MNNIKEERLDFEDMELLQLEFYVSEMEKNCSKRSVNVMNPFT